MNRLEAITCAKNPAFPELNEDRMVLVPGHGYAVIDGATDISGLRHDDRLGRGATGGRLAAAAIAEAFAAAWAVPVRDLPAASEVVGMATAAVAALYRRLRIAASVGDRPERRFRAGFVAALCSADTVRLVGVGDCGARVDGRAVLANVFPSDVVLSALRAGAFQALTARGATIAEARQKARQLIVEGAAAVERIGLAAQAGDAVLDGVRNDRAVLDAVAGDHGLLEAILAAGLAGIRQRPEAFRAVAVDGVDNVAAAASSVDLRRSDFRTIELFSDGYPSPPAAVGIDAWETALAEIDAADPERIGRYRSTKGRTEDSFGDDRTLVIVRNGAKP